MEDKIEMGEASASSRPVAVETSAARLKGWRPLQPTEDGASHTSTSCPTPHQGQSPYLSWQSQLPRWRERPRTSMVSGDWVEPIIWRRVVFVGL